MLKARAIYDCTADEEGELSFREGAILVDVRESEEEGWYEGRLKGTNTRGLFPYNYVEIFTDDEGVEGEKPPSTSDFTQLAQPVATAAFSQPKSWITFNAEQPAPIPASAPSFSPSSQNPSTSDTAQFPEWAKPVSKINSNLLATFGGSQPSQQASQTPLGKPALKPKPATKSKPFVGVEEREKGEAEPPREAVSVRELKKNLENVSLGGIAAAKPSSGAGMAGAGGALRSSVGSHLLAGALQSAEKTVGGDERKQAAGGVETEPSKPLSIRERQALFENLKQGSPAGRSTSMVSLPLGGKPPVAAKPVLARTFTGPRTASPEPLQPRTITSAPPALPKKPAAMAARTESAPPPMPPRPNSASIHKLDSSSQASPATNFAPPLPSRPRPPRLRNSSSDPDKAKEEPAKPPAPEGKAPPNLPPRRASSNVKSTSLSAGESTPKVTGGYSAGVREIPPPPGKTPPRPSRKNPFLVENGDGIPADARRRYEALFDETAAGAEYMEGTQVRQIFMRSKLDKKTLAKIWDLADYDEDGRLSRHEFCVGMHLIDERLRNHPLPDELPESLRP
ncbi:uncharacterized protein VTP21DRAFT_10615 [Calcarisporiella thermophila]|uniref:uncharacterized protein n=1 Tax=Calcarisporiella thermophila TaxID=911321 RepID=UPI003741FE9F